MSLTTKNTCSKHADRIVTIGTFDGLHIGHQKILKRVLALAQKDGLTATVLTLFPHPRMVLQKDSNIKLINTIDEKATLLERFGIDHLVVKKFTQEFSRLTAQEFVRDLLVNKLQTKHIIIGYDHHFGRNRSANINDLIEFGDIYDFKVKEITAQEIIKTKELSAQILADNCGKNFEQIMKDFQRDHWMGAEESVAYGIADGIIEG